MPYIYVRVQSETEAGRSCVNIVSLKCAHAVTSQFEGVRICEEDVNGVKHCRTLSEGEDGKTTCRYYTKMLP